MNATLAHLRVTLVGGSQDVTRMLGREQMLPGVCLVLADSQTENR